MMLFTLLLAVVYVIPFFFWLGSWWLFAWFTVGVILGILLMIADEQFFYRYYVNQTPTNFALLTRSPLFLVAYVALAFFAVTSSTNPLGIGVILGLGLTLAVEMMTLRRQPAVFKQRFFQHLSPQLKQTNITVFAWSSVVILAILTLLVITA